MKTWNPIVLLILLVQVSAADFYISYRCSFGIYDPSGTTGILPELGDTATVQLIALGTNGVYESQLSWPGGVPPDDFPLSMSGDDVLLWSGTFVNDNPAEYTQWAFGYYGDFYADYIDNGLVIGRIWNQRTKWYYEGHVQAMNDIYAGIPPEPPETYNLAQGQGNQLAIPEPSSAALVMLFGGIICFKIRILGLR